MDIPIMLRLDHPVKGEVTARAIVTSLRSDQISNSPHSS
jgi:hypothetical protein